MNNILIVDDERDILFGFQKFLQNSQMKVDTAETVDEAKALITRKEYRCVITDLRFAGFSDNGGFEILRWAKERDPKTEIIVMTGYGNALTMKEAYALGTSFYFEKPVSTETLKEALKKLGM